MGEGDIDHLRMDVRCSVGQAGGFYFAVRGAASPAQAHPAYLVMLRRYLLRRRHHRRKRTRCTLHCTSFPARGLQDTYPQSFPPHLNLLNTLTFSTYYASMLLCSPALASDDEGGRDAEKTARPPSHLSIFLRPGWQAGSWEPELGERWTPSITSLNLAHPDILTDTLFFLPWTLVTPCFAGPRQYVQSFSPVPSHAAASPGNEQRDGFQSHTLATFGTLGQGATRGPTKLGPGRREKGSAACAGLLRTDYYSIGESLFCILTGTHEHWQVATEMASSPLGSPDARIHLGVVCPPLIEGQAWVGFRRSAAPAAHEMTIRRRARCSTPYTLLHGHLALPLLRIQNVPDERNNELKRSIGYTTDTAVAHDEKWPFTAFSILRTTTPKQKQETTRLSLPFHKTEAGFTLGTRQKKGRTGEQTLKDRCPMLPTCVNHPTSTHPPQRIIVTDFVQIPTGRAALAFPAGANNDVPLLNGLTGHGSPTHLPTAPKQTSWNGNVFPTPERTTWHPPLPPTCRSFPPSRFLQSCNRPPTAPRTTRTLCTDVGLGAWHRHFSFLRALETLASDYYLRSLVESALPWIAALSPVPRLGSCLFLAAGFVVGAGGVHNDDSRAQLQSGQLSKRPFPPTTWPLDDKAFVPAKDEIHSSRLAKHPSCSFTLKYPSQPLGQDWRRGEADQPTQSRCISTPPSLARRPCPSPLPFPLVRSMASTLDTLRNTLASHHRHLGGLTSGDPPWKTRGESTSCDLVIPNPAESIASYRLQPLCETRERGARADTQHHIPSNGAQSVPRCISRCILRANATLNFSPEKFPLVPDCK
ncbi:uncharacterized protein CLUP02_17334 [Colletotrichum lupini]|uniref:Uncharacterized protein n=1 Tax=Colletotrichum lupini TaxID=145971 RepID=A0A9Q8SEN0_9PEZI|nr:uncharacterized protein CLUP02_17334 [Colletotrichum lupini]UQC75825.1 hypothetical protein CLUP02_17334 [Colletotrichum lupini]